jgi:flagellar motor switch protein FliN/FliY
LQLDETPLFGFSPPFPFEDVAEGLKNLFEIEDLSIRLLESKWREKETLLEGLPKNLMAKNLSIAPIEGTLCFALPKDDLQSMMGQLLRKQLDPLETFDEEFLQSFEHFLTLETLHTITSSNFDKTLSYHIEESVELPDEPAFCQDIEISLPGKTFIARLFIPNGFRQSWKERYSPRKLEDSLKSSLASKTDLFVHLQVGRVLLTPSEWKQIRPGDFVILDTCMLDPETLKGRVILTLQGKPLFRGKFKEGTLKILEYPLHHKVETSMVEEEYEEPEIEEEETEEEEEELEESEEEEEETEESREEKEEEPAPQEEYEEKKVEDVEIAKTEEIIAPEEIPMIIHVELGRMQMSLKKLLELQPGNILELALKPEDGVDLIVGGKRIAKAELIKIGETLGVRILDM